MAAWIEAPSAGAPAPRRLALALAALWLACLAMAGPAAAQVQPLGAHPVAASRAISLLVAARDSEAGADFGGRLMAGASDRDRLLPIMKQMADYGENQYLERVYERAVGTSAYDIIDKLNFDRAVIFIRYSFQVERGAWLLVNISYKTESVLPLPRDWVHIYPDGLLGPGGR